MNINEVTPDTPDTPDSGPQGGCHGPGDPINISNPTAAPGMEPTMEETPKKYTIKRGYQPNNYQPAGYNPPGYDPTVTVDLIEEFKKLLDAMPSAKWPDFFSTVVEEAKQFTNA